jgi:hypothetical protein
LIKAGKRCSSVIVVSEPSAIGSTLRRGRPLMRDAQGLL